MEDRLTNLGLNEGDLVDAQLEIVNESIAVYNETYQTNYTIDTIPLVILSFIALNALMTLNGWNRDYRNRFDTQTIDLIKSVYGEEYESYGGITDTNQTIVDNRIQEGVEFTEDVQQSFIETRADVLFAGLFVSYQIAQQQLADNDGRTFVGAVTRRDGRVRPTHRPNDNRYWERGTRPDFSHDYGCRCTYFYFSTEQEAQDAGFSPI